MNERLKKGKYSVVIGIFLVLIIGLCILYYLSNPINNAIKKYNKAVMEYNSLAKEYNSLVKNSYVANIKNMPLDYVEIKKEKAGMWGSIKVLFTSNTVDKILKDTKTIDKLAEEVKINNQIIDSITSPSENEVIDKLKNIIYIKDIKAVTDKNDPNGLLGKEGGYQSCIYFSLNALDNRKISGNNIIEKGTDAGGSIEVYKSLEDAKQRCEYLKSFDGTLLYSGSYAIVGTMVIRTSYLLKAEDQLILTNEITKAFTSEENKKEIISMKPSLIYKIEVFLFTSGMDVLKKTVEDVNGINKICEELNKIKCDKYDSNKMDFNIGPVPILFRIYSEHEPVKDIKILTIQKNNHLVSINKELFNYQGSVEEIFELFIKLKGKIKKLDRLDIEI